MTAKGSQVSTDWAWWSLLPLGFGAWTPIYAGARARRPLWIAAGVAWSAIALVGFFMSNGHNHTAGAFIMLGWVGGAVTAFVLREPYRRALTDPQQRALRAARERIRSREEAQALAASDPELAREAGIGRPDVRGALDGGVVDVNAASAATLARLPGVDAHLAEQIAAVRDRIGGFSSAEDLGALLDLDPGLVAELRERTVYIGR